ncbi:hypothetical protein BDB00DRAFT_783400 [Zychaea mexicana]|uniref:uncharacterized protein n=1 Tax=Zychaea mexicana TaxID=64656 RepID=UPI0022FE650D|nr:uncharacterized protein BDB00DRAFT_783400 [Zychaea mexicana]KAI9499333.1 hypothetical protein BDB00DRAFT_783400 [Zychaea mexicana]
MSNVNDPSWSEYFTGDELEEISNHNNPALPKVSEKVKNHLDLFRTFDASKNPNGKTTEELMAYQVNNTGLDYKEDFDLIGINNSIAQATELYRWAYFPLTDHSEGDLLRRVWQFVDTCFDDQKIQVRGGEKTSAASALRKNEGRNNAGVEAMTRKALGHRGDLIFVKSGLELGCGELGRYDRGPKGSKEMREGFLKTPKMMKDELCALIAKCPDQVAKLRIVGFISMGNLETCLIYI